MQSNPNEQQQGLLTDEEERVLECLAGRKTPQTEEEEFAFMLGEALRSVHEGATKI